MKLGGKTLQKVLRNSAFLSCKIQMKTETKKKIKEYIDNYMEKFMEEVVVHKDLKASISTNPFLERLFPAEIFNTSRIATASQTRIVSKSFYNKIAKIIVEGEVPGSKVTIKKPIYIDSLNTKYCDLYIQRENELDEAYFFETSRHNRDSIEHLNRYMLSIVQSKQDFTSYLALIYNSSLIEENLKVDNYSILVGKCIWNHLGQNDDTYTELLQVIEEVGGDYTQTIKEKVLSTTNMTTKPLIITEGKTDWKHLKNALRYFKKQGEFSSLDIEFLEYENEQQMGDDQLEKLLKELSKIPHISKVIGVFDRDARSGRNIAKKGLYVPFGNNVYGFALPTPSFRTYHLGICIEFLYKNEDLLREDSDGKRLYLSSEFSDRTGRHNKNKYINYINVHKLKNKTLIENEIIIDDDVYNIDEKKVTITKNMFAEYILNEKENFKDIDLIGFEGVFEVIQEILQQ